MFLLEDFHGIDVIPLEQFKSKEEIFNFPNRYFEIHYNSYGYRTIDFNTVPDEYTLVSGCSLTEGIGLPLEQTWVNHYEKMANTTVVNLAKEGSNAQFCSKNILNWLISDRNNPSQVIVQWPNPYRCLTWDNLNAKFNLNSDRSSIYNLYIKNSDNNFWDHWLTSIINLNLYCNIKNIKILNICLEGPDVITDYITTILSKHNIELHLDLKKEGATWHFDSAAYDNSHHSNWCNQKWAERIISLLQSTRRSSYCLTS